MRHAARCMLTRSSVSCGLITTTGSLRWLLAQPKPITAMVMHRNKTWGLVQVDGCIKWLLASTIDTISDGLCGMSTTVMGSTNHRDVTNMQFFDTLILTSSRLTPPPKTIWSKQQHKERSQEGSVGSKRDHPQQFGKIGQVFVSFCEFSWDFSGYIGDDVIRHGARCMGPPPPSLPFHKIAAGGTANALAAWKMPGRPTSGVSMLSYRHPPICQFCFSVWCLVFVP